MSRDCLIGYTVSFWSDGNVLGPEEWMFAQHCSVLRALYLPRGRTAWIGLHRALPGAEEQPEDGAVLFMCVTAFENTGYVVFVKIVGTSHQHFAGCEPFCPYCALVVVLSGP